MIFNVSNIQMHTFINLLIGLLIGLILYNSPFFRIREGQMVGSIMFPTMYKGKTEVTHKPIKVKENTDVFTQVDTDVVEKKDVRVDTDVKVQHWKEKKKDVDEKKDVDVIHRYPQVWQGASIKDCNRKKRILFHNYNRLQDMQKEVKYMKEWINKLVPRIIENEKLSKTNTNNIKKTEEIVSDATKGAREALDKI